MHRPFPRQRTRGHARPAPAILTALLAGAVAASLGAAGGCSSGNSNDDDPRPRYAAPARPAGELALVYAGGGWLAGYYGIREVDGARIAGRTRPNEPSPGPVSVLPGLRRLTVVANQGHWTRGWTVVYRFLPGHTYVIGPSRADGGLQVIDREANAATVFE